MEHPLIGNLDDLTLEELQTKIQELTKKRAWALRGNAQLANQIGMALESYQNKYRERQQAMLDKMTRDGPDYSEKIDIS
jgi:hypothetical protein